MSVIKRLAAKIDVLERKVGKNIKQNERLSKQIKAIAEHTTGVREFKYESRQLAWSEANAECKKWGGNLLTIKSRVENDYFKKEMIRRNMGWEVWIGLTDEKEEGDFIWTSNEEGFYCNWLEGEPNGGRAENCVHLIPSMDGRWNDISCTPDVKANFVCERRKLKL